MKRKKNALRIGTSISILLLILIPLLSSNVAAVHTVLLGSVTTNNTIGGPTATGAVNGAIPGTILDNGPFNANYVVDYSYTDSNPFGNGSDHWIQVNVSYGYPGTPPTTITFTQSPPIFIAANAGTVTGSYTTPWIVGYGNKGIIFTVTFGVYCRDRSSWTTVSWFSTPIVYLVV